MTSHHYLPGVRFTHPITAVYVVNVNWSGNGIDYTSIPINATFPVGTNSTTIDIPVTKDNTVEEVETFNLNFSIPSSLQDRVIPGDITTAIGMIIDDTGKIVICL